MYAHVVMNSQPTSTRVLDFHEGAVQCLESQSVVVHQRQQKSPWQRRQEMFVTHGGSDSLLAGAEDHPHSQGV